MQSTLHTRVARVVRVARIEFYMISGFFLPALDCIYENFNVYQISTLCVNNNFYSYQNLSSKFLFASHNAQNRYKI